MPTLFLEGSDSPEAFHEAGEAIRNALPDCKVVVLEGERHAAIDTATELFTGEVLRFLLDT